MDINIVQTYVHADLVQCITLNILKDCHLGYLNLKIYGPIKFVMAIYFNDIKNKKFQ